MLTDELLGDVHPRVKSVYEKENAVPGVSPVIAAKLPTPDCVKPGGVEFTVQPDAGKPER
jgi:hypothetical protein